MSCELLVHHNIIWLSLCVHQVLMTRKKTHSVIGETKLLPLYHFHLSLYSKVDLQAVSHFLFWMKVYANIYLFMYGHEQFSYKWLDS